MSAESDKTEMLAISRSISNFDAGVLESFTNEFRARQRRLNLASRAVKFVPQQPEVEPYIDLVSAAELRLFLSRIGVDVRDTGVNGLIESLDENWPPLLDEPLVINSYGIDWFHTRSGKQCMKIGVCARTLQESQICKDAIADYYQVEPGRRDALWRTNQDEPGSDPGLPFARVGNEDYEKLFGYVSDALRESDVLHRLVAEPAEIVEL